MIAGPWLSPRPGGWWNPVGQTAPLTGASISEGDVVLLGANARRLPFEVRGVRGDIGLWRSGAVAGPLAVAGAEELDRVGDDLHRLALSAPILRLPFAPLKAPVHGDRAALGEVGGAVLALRAPDGDVEVVGLVDPVAGGGILAAAVHGHAELADGVTARQAAQLGVAGQVPCDHDPIEVGACHFWLPSRLYFSRPDLPAWRSTRISCDPALLAPRALTKPQVAVCYESSRSGSCSPASEGASPAASASAGSGSSAADSDSSAAGSGSSAAAGTGWASSEAAAGAPGASASAVSGASEAPSA